VVELPTVPHQLLRDAPLVDREWLDLLRHRVLNRRVAA
jgi:hypothetical protein